MNLSAYSLKKIVPFILGDQQPYSRTGSEIVALFNKFGIRDVYENGLPLNPASGLKFARKDYTFYCLGQLTGKSELRSLISLIAKEAAVVDDSVTILNSILSEEGYGIQVNNGIYEVVGGVIDKSIGVENNAHFIEIQDKILSALDNAQVSITIAMAWFTNQILMDKLVEKSSEGVEVKIAVYKDGINSTHGVDLSPLENVYKIRGSRGGIMHNKFCVIDNQTVITGSYNWSINAETRNDENVTVSFDPPTATKFSVEFRRLVSVRE